jgi:hypothetical protein
MLFIMLWTGWVQSTLARGCPRSCLHAGSACSLNNSMVPLPAHLAGCAFFKLFSVLLQMASMCDGRLFISCQFWPLVSCGPCAELTRWPPGSAHSPWPRELILVMRYWQVELSRLCAP